MGFTLLTILPSPGFDPSGNGVSDVFEAHYGLSGTDPAGSDDDGDGFSLLHEFLIGSNPTVRDGWSAIEAEFRLSTNGLSTELDFRPQTGLRYEIQSSATLATGDWPAEDEILGDGAVHPFSYPVAGSRHFYRVAALGPDPDADGDGLDSREEALLGTPVDDPDQDGDSLNDAGEFLAGSHANNPDSDGDGLPDGYEAVTPDADPMIPGSHTLSTLDYFENCESLTDGLLNGQDGWVVAADTQALVQSGTAGTGLKAIQLTGLDRPVVAEKYFDGAAVPNVWIEFQLLPGATVAEPPVLGTVAATAVYFTATGHLKAFDGTSGSWVEDSFAGGIDELAWRRLTFNLDYENQRWLVYVNGSLVNPAPGGVPSWFGFSNPSPFFYRLSFSAQGSGNELYIDDILVTTTPPAGLDVTP